MSKDQVKPRKTRRTVTTDAKPPHSKPAPASKSHEHPARPAPAAAKPARTEHSRPKPQHPETAHSRQAAPPAIQRTAKPAPIHRSSEKGAPSQQPAHRTPAPAHSPVREHRAPAVHPAPHAAPHREQHAPIREHAHAHSPFDDFGLAPEILRAVSEEGYTQPTPIQQQSIEPILQGRDLLGCAQTGTGKTAAFALPILHRLRELPIEKSRAGRALPRALILAPTRELATQIGESFAAYGRHAGLRCAVIFGGVSQVHQVKAVQGGADILVATPGRLLDLMQQRHVDLSAINIYVLDEADRMLDMGFIPQIRRITTALRKPGERQTLLFSATMPPPIMYLADSLLHDPVRVAVKPVVETPVLIDQAVYMVVKNEKAALLRRLLADHTIERALVFTRTKHGADRLCRQLSEFGIASDAIHGNKAQNQRKRTLDNFRAGRARILVATDLASRGLDIDGITHVVNYDMPAEPEAYVHRIGRTGRAGATGVAISFCDYEEFDQLRSIERLIGKPVPRIQAPRGQGAIEPQASQRHPGQAAHAPRGHSAATQTPAGAPAHPERSGESHGHSSTHGHAAAHDKKPPHGHSPTPAPATFGRSGCRRPFKRGR